MADRFINLELGGAPIVMYGAIATTVIVIAYATSSGAFGDQAKKLVGMASKLKPKIPSFKNKEETKEEKPSTELKDISDDSSRPPVSRIWTSAIRARNGSRGRS